MLLAPYYYYGFHQLLQMERRGEAAGPFVMLSAENYKQLIAELHDDLFEVAKMLNILMLEKRQYDVPVEMAKRIINRVYSGHWSKDRLYLVNHFWKALLALLPPNFLAPREVATVQVRQHMHGEQRLQNLLESLKVFDKGTAEGNVAQRKERAQKRKSEVMAQDEERKQNVLYSYTDHQNNKITVTEKMFDMYGKIQEDQEEGASPGRKG